MRSKFAIYILLCITGCLVINSVVFGQSNRQLKQAIARSLASEKLTGAVWTIVESDGSIRTASAGIKNNDSKELLLPTDRVHVKFL